MENVKILGDEEFIDRTVWAKAVAGNESQFVTILGRAIKFYHEGNL